MKETVGVIGLGYVGLPLVREFIAHGFRVTGFDVDEAKIARLENSESYLKHIPSSLIAEWNRSRRFVITGDFSRLKDVEAIIVCVPTPLDPYRVPDLTYVTGTAETIARHIRPGQLVVLESTTYPGTTEEVMLPILEGSGLRAGEDFYLAYSPEREDPGSKTHTTATIPKIVGGYTSGCSRRALDLYSRIVDTVPVSSIRVAEAAKILENTYRAVNIALVNELKMLFEKMDINVWEVIEAAKTKPFGFHAFYPGPGLGGHCIPIDPFYLTWKAKEHDFSTRFIELAGEINTHQPYHVVSRIGEVLNLHGKAIKDSRILLVGMAYKPDVDDVRESPALKIYDLLRDKGAQVDYYDPLVATTGPHRHYPDVRLDSIAYSREAIRGFDLVSIITDHAGIPYREILEDAPLIVDTRNVYRSPSHKVFKA